MAEDVTNSGVAAEELKSFVERVEQIESEIDDRNTDKKEIYSEMKGRGFDVPVVKQIIALRRKDPAKRQERQAILELYAAALGVEL